MLRKHQVLADSVHTHRMNERPDVYVLRIDPTIPSSRDEVLARLRHPDGDGLHTSYWRFETGHGDVLAERSGGEVTIYRDVCRRVLGEEP